MKNIIYKLLASYRMLWLKIYPEPGRLHDKEVLNKEKEHWGENLVNETLAKDGLPTKIFKAVVLSSTVSFLWCLLLSRIYENNLNTQPSMLLWSISAFIIIFIPALCLFEYLGTNKKRKYAKLSIGNLLSEKDNLIEKHWDEIPAKTYVRLSLPGKYPDKQFNHLASAEREKMLLKHIDNKLKNEPESVRETFNVLVKDSSEPIGEILKTSKLLNE